MTGYQIEPGPVAALLHQESHLPISAVFTVRYDEDAVFRGFTEHPEPNDWVTQFSRQELTLRRIAKMVCQYSALISAEATAENLTVVNMDGDLKQRAQDAISLLRG